MFVPKNFNRVRSVENDIPQQKEPEKYENEVTTSKASVEQKEQETQVTQKNETTLHENTSGQQTMESTNNSTTTIQDKKLTFRRWGKNNDNNTSVTPVKPIPQMSQVNQQPPEEFNGEKIENLQATGFKTESVLKYARESKPQFNLRALESLPLPFVFHTFDVEAVNNVYHFMGYDFVIKEDKWYNKTINKGAVNAISLTKQLIAIKEDLNEFDNQKPLFIASCKHLTHWEPQKAQFLATRNQKVEHNNPSPQEENKEKVEDNTPKKQTRTKADWAAINAQLNSIPLEAVMEYLGSSPNEDGHRGKWKMAKTGHNIQVNGNQWKNWNGDGGGHGAISLMVDYISYVENIDTRSKDGNLYAFKLATQELMKEFGSDYDSSMIDTGTPVYKVPFSMPLVIDFKINEARDYLHEKRGLPLWIINKQIETGNLFAGLPSDWPKSLDKLKNPTIFSNDDVWVVFLANNGNAAEMRGIVRTDNYAKILATGSDKTSGGFLIRHEKAVSEKTVVALEAAIDSMSYHAFYPGKIAMSCMGVNFNLGVKSALEAFDAGYKFELAFDNDKAGNEATVNFKNALIEEIGDEQYPDLIQKKYIKLFDLGTKVAKETIDKNEVYYFDTLNNSIGAEAVAMFREQLVMKESEEVVRQWEKKGKIKYTNICPDFKLIRDPKLEAQQVVDLLNSGNSYYLRYIDNDPEEDPEEQKNRLIFEDTVMELAGDKVDQWKNDGLLIFSKKAIAKDWNEFFIYKKNNDPEFAQYLKEQENTYLHYSTPKEKEETNTEPSKNKMKRI